MNIKKKVSTDTFFKIGILGGSIIAKVSSQISIFAMNTLPVQEIYLGI